MSNVESPSTALSAVPGQMSKSNRHNDLQCFLLVFINLLLSGVSSRNLNIRYHVAKLIWTRLLKFRIIIWASRFKMDGRPVFS